MEHKMKKFTAFCFLLILLCTFTNCTKSPKGKNESQPSGTQQKLLEQKANEPESGISIKLATTTSVDNSGLLAYLLPLFKKETGIGVDVIAVGTGQALQQARDGNVDVVIVHDRKAEEQFISEGYGLERKYICENQFVIVGPESDPANVVIASDAKEAFTKIMETKSIFVSRGDDSGTHKAEKRIWQAAGLIPKGEWYIEAGQGMGAVLTMADEKQGYTLTDTGTFYSMIDKIQLVAIFAGDPDLVNVYSIIPLNPEKLRNIKKDAASKFVDWITSPETKKLIAAFEVNGHKLFDVKDMTTDSDEPVSSE